MVRCFVALDLPEPVRNHLANVTRPLHGQFDVRWVPPDQMHATLVFAGELADDAWRALAAAIDEVALPPLSLHLQTLGHFPPKGVPRVLWAGLHGDVDAVVQLHADLTARAIALEVPRDKRGFTPHVTLGRLKTTFGALALTGAMQKLAPALRSKPFAPVALTLYASELQPSGPIYEVLHRRALPPAAG